jgi:hypothetical protein
VSTAAGRRQPQVLVSLQLRPHLRHPGGKQRQTMSGACTTTGSGRPLYRLELQGVTSARRLLLSCPSPQPVRPLSPHLCQSASAPCT